MLKDSNGHVVPAEDIFSKHGSGPNYAAVAHPGILRRKNSRGNPVARKSNPLLKAFLDKSVPLPVVHWETVPPGVSPDDVWESFDEGVEGWVFVWFPSHDPATGRSYGEFERAYLFNAGLERILKAMNRWPLWGNAKQRKHAVAFALLQLFCEAHNLCERV